MKKIAVAVKRSKWERDLRQYGSPEEVRRIYEIQNSVFAKVYASHLRQFESLNTLKQRIPRARFLFREELNSFDFSSYDLLLSPGGDNHFVYVSQFADSKLPLVGINTDPQTSLGALLYFNAANFAAKLPENLDDLYLETENWTRIDCELRYPDGRILQLFPAMSEISIHSAFPDHISRYIVRKQEENWEEQKSSGLLLSTGDGSTGWFRNCHWSHLQENAAFPKNAKFFRLIARELRSTKKYRYHLASIPAEESLEVVSEMEGKIVIDSHPESCFDFPPGCRAKFKLSKKTLSVVREIGSKPPSSGKSLLNPGKP